MLISELYPSKWLAAADLPNGTATVTIAVLTVEELGQSRERKPVLKFHEFAKRLVLNKTNGRKLASLFGMDTERWIGQRVDLRVGEVEVAGERHQSIRVIGAANGAEDRDQEIPF